MRQPINWQDHVVEHPNRYKEVDNGDGTFDLQKFQGEILQQGTPMNATNFNNMDYGILEAAFMASDLIRETRIMKDSIRGITGDKIQLTLTNSQVYPHNNSKKTVQISPSRNTRDYTVECDVVSVSGGSIGEFEISDKLLNGFKIAFTGSAKSVVVNCYVRGGI